jgi:hypothetical protein
MNQQELNAWAWVGFKIALAIITVLNIKRIFRGFLTIFGPDGVDKREFCATVLLGLGIYMINLEGHRSDLQHQLFSDWQYFIVFGGSMLGFGMKEILKLFALKTGNVQKAHDTETATTEPDISSK